MKKISLLLVFLLLSVLQPFIAKNVHQLGIASVTSTSYNSVSISNDMFREAMFADMVKAEVNSTFPFTYDGSETYKDIAHEETLQAVTLYAQTHNETYLIEAEKTANWLVNQSDIRRIAMGYNTTSHLWDKTYSVGRVGAELGYLSLLVSFTNSTYKNLVQKLVDIVTSYCINSASGIPYDHLYTSNNTSNTSVTSIGPLYSLAEGMTYASYVMSNATMKNVAFKLIMNWTCGTPAGGLLPAYQVDNTNGAIFTDYVKEDEGDALYLYDMEEFLYFYPTNTTMANHLYSVAWATGEYVWNPTSKLWNYRTNTTTGAPVWEGPVHGFGMTDEAMFIAGLMNIAGSNLKGNGTWIHYAEQDYVTNVINGGLLTNGLIDHTLGEYEAEDMWNQYARRVGIIFSYNGNLTYFKTANWLFGNMTTKMNRTLGWQSDVYTTAPYEDYGYPNSRIPLVTSAIFVNKTGVSITYWYDVFQNFGFPQFGYAPQYNSASGSQPSGGGLDPYAFAILCFIFLVLGGLVGLALGASAMKRRLGRKMLEQGFSSFFYKHFIFTFTHGIFFLLF